jgi:intein-encoded DNA endonuclease-like protein
MEKLLKAKEEYLNSSITLTNICKKYNFTRWSFTKYLKTNNICTKRKISAHENIFENIDSEEKAYWLGFLYADGSITYNINQKRYVVEIGLSIKDINHLINFKKFINTDKDIEIKDDGKTCRISVNSKKICEDLIKLGCIPKKSLILKFPNKNQVNKKFIRHFIRGYFDGDGCISFNKRSRSFKVTLLGTIEFVNGIIKKLNLVEYKIDKDRRHLGNTFTLRFNSIEGFNFINLLYLNSNIYLNRKFERYSIILNRRLS